MHWVCSFLRESILFAINAFIRKETLHSLDLRSALWIAPFIIGMGIISFTGNFGGQGLLSETVENLLIVALSIGVLYLAVYLSLEPDKSAEHYRLQMQDETGGDHENESSI